MFKELQNLTPTFFLIIISGFLLVSCSQHASEGMIIMTQVDKDVKITEFKKEAKLRIFSEAKIMMIDPANPERRSWLLSKNFYSACSPQVSFDAKKMVFSGQKYKNDIWQIYEMDLASLAYEPLTNAKENCTDPVYLPGNRFVYNRDFYSENGEKGQALFVKSIGEDLEEQITFSPGQYNGTSVLHDGRIISMNSLLASGSDKSKLMVMRPDGTKEMLFYKSEENHQLIAKGLEANNGEIYIIEKNGNGISNLYSISYNNPLESRKLLSAKITGDFIGLNTLSNGHLLVCYRESNQESYGLYELDPKNMKLIKSIFHDSQYKTIEAVAVEQHKIPKNIPSEVNLNEQTALLLCQDVNFIGFHQNSMTTKGAKAVKVEILGLESSMGTVDVEKDGSVYLKIKADTPFQLQTLNEEGAIVNGPSSWINLRPNERRACVGCHQGNEYVPENKQPLSVLKEPIRIPQEPKLLAGRE